jgi:Bifunctional DNA primase/polymerase, N-terminal
MINENPHRVVPDAARVEEVDQFRDHQSTVSAPSIQPQATGAETGRFRSASTRDRALGYIQRGWSPIQIPLGEKRPRLTGWQRLRLNEADALQHFNGVGNIGIILGEASGGLVDVDQDCPEAIDLSPKFVPATGAIFGRASKPRSHRLYRVEGAAPTIQLKDPLTGKMLVELRGDGGFQTIFPGSTHGSGELIEWEEDGEPAIVSYVDLSKAVRKLAAYCLFKRHLPDVRDHESLLTALETAEPCLADRIRDWLEIEPPPTAEHCSGSIFDPGQPLPDYIHNRTGPSIAERFVEQLNEHPA